MEKTATRRLVRGENGKLTVVFIDLKTGKPITNLRGYKIIGQGDNLPQSEKPEEKEETEDTVEEEKIIRGEGRGDYRGDPSVAGNLGLDLTKEQKAALSKVIGGVAGAYFGGPIGGVLGAKIAERIIPKLMEEVATVKKEEEAIAPQAVTEKISGNPTTVEYTPGIAEEFDALDEKQSLTSAAIEENPQNESETIKAMDDAMRVDKNTDLEDRPRNISSMDYDLGPNRNNIPEGEISAQLRDVVTDVLGPDYSVRATSGQESVNPITGKRGQYGSNRHRTGMALDGEIIDPQGNPVTDRQKIKDVAQLGAARYGANFGFGPEYMGTSVFHMDTVPAEDLDPGQAAQWGSLGKRWGEDLAMAREEGVASPAYYDRMTQNAPTGLMTREEALASPNSADVNVAFDRFKPEERDLMARTLAGEIDLSKTDLSTEEGRKEAFGILSTMENRAAKFGGIEQAITADKQYSTWNDPKAAGVANANYEANREVYDSLVNEMERDASLNQGYTSYHANDVNPSWSAKMSGVTNIGPHIFGSLPEYASAGKFGQNFGQYDMTKANVQNPQTDQVAGTSGLMADATANVSLSTEDTFNSSGWGGMVSDENANKTSSTGFGGSSDGFGSSEDHSSDASSTGGLGDRDTTGSSIGGGLSTSTGTGGSFTDSGDYSGFGGSDSPGEGRGRFGGDGLGTSTGTGSTSTGTGSTSTGTSTGGHGFGGGDPDDDGMGGRSDGWG